jgi:hypothetical protein
MWIDDYVGLPFRHGQFECGDLVRKILAERFGIEQAVPESLEAYIAEAAKAGEWARVKVPQAGDGVVMMTAIGGGKVAPLHVGVMVSESHLVHVDIDRTSVCVAVSNPMIRARIDGFYRHRSLVTP